MGDPEPKKHFLGRTDSLYILINSNNHFYFIVGEKIILIELEWQDWLIRN